LVFKLTAQVLPLTINCFIEVTKKMKSINNQRGMRKYRFGCIDKPLPHVRAEDLNPFTPLYPSLFKVFNHIVQDKNR
jgi:hypothetical protein